MQVNERWEWGSAPPLHGGPGVLKALSEEPCPSTNRSVTLNAISLAPPPGKPSAPHFRVLVAHQAGDLSTTVSYHI